MEVPWLIKFWLNERYGYKHLLSATAIKNINLFKDGFLLFG